MNTIAQAEARLAAANAALEAAKAERSEALSALRQARLDADADLPRVAVWRSEYLRAPRVGRLDVIVRRTNATIYARAPGTDYEPAQFRRPRKRHSHDGWEHWPEIGRVSSRTAPHIRVHAETGEVDATPPKDAP